MTSLGNQSKLLNDIFLLDKHWYIYFNASYI